MADRYFPNEMPDFVEESEEAAASAGSSLMKLLSLPYPKTSQLLLRAALDLKDKVVKETWVQRGQRVTDYTLYTGALGTAFLLLKAYQLTNSHSDLRLCKEIINACDFASRGSKQVTFICDCGGVLAIGSVAANHSGDELMLNHHLNSFKEIKLSPGIPNELLYGRAGYLWACSFLNKHLGKWTIPLSHTDPIVKAIIADGRRLSTKSGSPCPLMYEWHGTRYWGAAHGLAGIMHVLMEMPLSTQEKEYVKGTLRYMIQNCFPSGNYPSSEGKDTDRLVHWCHGASGIVLTLAKAAQVFEEEEFLHAAVEAAEVVWNRGLLKRVGICHGVSGNAYVFLSLYRLTGKVQYLYRAKAFSCFLLDRANQLIAAGEMHSGDRPYSLFEGLAGMAHLFLDMVNPSESRFPGYEL